MRVLVTRPANEAQAWVAQLRDRGFDAVSLPLIDIAPVTRPEALDALWAGLDAFRAVMFVSGNAVRHFVARRPAGAAAWPPLTRAWATGAGTRHALVDAGLPAGQIDSPPDEAVQFDSETLWAEVSSQVRPGDRVLLVRGADSAGESGSGRDWLADTFRSAGAQVQTVAAYVRVLPAMSDAQLREAVSGAAGGAWLFSSSQAIANLQVLLPSQSWNAARAVATHPRIAEAARRADFGVVCESRPSVDAVARALESSG